MTSSNPSIVDFPDFQFDQSCRIGSGSFATVYSGQLKATGEPVAVKAVEMRKLNKKLQQNLQTEISIMRDHDHVNLVKLHEVEVCPNRVCRTHGTCAYSVPLTINMYIW